MPQQSHRGQHAELGESGKGTTLNRVTMRRANGLICDALQTLPMLRRYLLESQRHRSSNRYDVVLTLVANE